MPRTATKRQITAVVITDPRDQHPDFQTFMDRWQTEIDANPELYPTLASLPPYTRAVIGLARSTVSQGERQWR